MSAPTTALDSWLPTPRPSISARHVPALDGIRGLAVLLVMWPHFCLLQTGQPGKLFRASENLASLGQAGVDLFFVLSGFLITGILLDSKRSIHFFRNFYIRRTLRIFPLYFGYLTVLYVAGPLLHLWAWTPFGEQWWFWSYMQNFGQTFLSRPLDGPAHFWSLSVEEHFYLFWPFLVSRLRTPALTRALIVMVGASLLSRILLMHLGFGTFYFTACRLDGLSIGSLLAVLQRAPAGLTRARGAAKSVFIACVVASPVFLLVTAKSIAAVQVFKNTAMAIVCAAVLVLALMPNGGVLKRLFGSSALRSIGKYSYGMYVLHGVVFAAYARYVNLRSPSLGLVLAFAATWGIAFLVWHGWEQHFLKLKDRLASL